MSPKNWALFRQRITEHFSVEELRTLCFDLGIEYAALAGRSKEAKILELLRLLQRNDRFPQLIEALEEERPVVNWRELVPKTSRPDSTFSIGKYTFLFVVIVTVVFVMGYALVKNTRLKPDDELTPTLEPVNSAVNETIQRLPTSVPIAPPSNTPVRVLATKEMIAETAVSGRLLFSLHPNDAISQVNICVLAGNNELTCLGQGGFYPVWSPDGSEIIFMQQGMGEPSKIYRMAADGSNPSQVIIPEAYKNPRQPDWSGDGRSLIFIAELETHDLFIWDFANESTRRLTKNSDFELNPDWSPTAVSSPQVLYVSWYGDPPVKGIFSLAVEAPSEDARQLRFAAASAQETISSPIWSPNGKQIAFIYERDTQAICVLPVADTTSPKCFDTAVDERGLAWSPDGRSLAYIVNTDEETRILQLDIDSGSISELFKQKGYKIAGLSWQE